LKPNFSSLPKEYLLRGQGEIIACPRKKESGVRVGKTEPLEENSFCHKNI